jgi:hypothetical protein
MSQQGDAMADEPREEGLDIQSDHVELAPVMPEGAEANEGMGARTIGTDDTRHGGAGGGAGPGSNPPLGGQQS